MNTPRSPDIIGQTRLAELDTVAVSVAAESEPVPKRRGGDVPVSPVATLEIRRGPDAGHRFVLATAATALGRHPGCEIVLSHVTVSRRHAELRPAHHGFVLVDTGSFNGSYLNGSPIDTAPLTDGDEIQIGIFRLTFHAGQHTTQPAPGSPAMSAPQPSAAPTAG
jgi:Inner membrane component of T3SS, cytoplasmic domain